RPKPNAIETAFSWLQPSVRFALDDVVELPEAITRTVNVDLSEQQQKVYEQVRKDLIAMIKQKQVTALNAGVALGKLLQISGGWVYASGAVPIRLDAAPRIGALID